MQYLARTLATALVLATTTACGLEIVMGSGESRTESFEISEFIELSNGTPMDIEVGVAEQASLEITCDDNLFEYIRVSSDDRELKLDLHNGSLPAGALQIKPQSPCFATVMAQILDPSASQPTTHIEKIRNAGQGNISMAGIDSAELSIDTAGSGDVTLAGAVDVVAVQTSGSGEILALDLVTEDASIELAGSGDVELTATGCATVTILGSGDVHLAGDPRICDFDRVGSGQLLIE